MAQVMPASKGSMRAVLLLMLLSSVLCARVEDEPDFSAFDTVHPWIVSPEIIAKAYAYGRAPESNFDESKVPRYQLPELMRFLDGRPVDTPTDWENRRIELIELFRQNVFGTSPPKPDTLAFSLVDRHSQSLDGRATFKRVAIRFHAGGDSFVFHVTLYVPNQRQRPAPVFLLIRHKARTPAHQAAEDGGEFWPVGYALKRGYAMMVMDAAAEVDPDEPRADSGVRAFYRRQETGNRTFTWRMLAAWAWGAARAMDYIETDPDLDAHNVAVVGHSRGGKAALWAGAQDERFRLVIPNNAGDGATCLVRRRLGNTIEVMTTRNPHWFVDRYATYAQREASAPFDQHMLIALVAPRGYHAGDGSEDLWHDPLGSWFALREASKAWTLSASARSMEDKPMPEVNELVRNGAIAYHLRTGGHALRLIDWKLYFDHADAFFGANPPGR